MLPYELKTNRLAYKDLVRTALWSMERSTSCSCTGLDEFLLLCSRCSWIHGLPKTLGRNRETLEKCQLQ